MAGWFDKLTMSGFGALRQNGRRNQVSRILTGATQAAVIMATQATVIRAA